MNGWWDDYLALTFKRGVLLKEQVKDVVYRYLEFVRRATITLASVFVALLLCFAAGLAVDIHTAWVYQVLILLMAGILLILILIALPLLVLSHSLYEVLPEAIRKSFFVWRRRGSAILFGALLAVVLVRAFRLWESPDRMVTVGAIVSLLWVGSYLV
jgi:hypothetical protein